MHPRLLTLVAVCSLCACGGSWSNRDLEFASALPSRAELKSKLPTTASGTSPLTGVGVQRDGLNVGDPSKAYADAKNAATTFNGILDFLLTILDNVRALPPTTRTTDSRTWGPYSDSKNPGFEFLVTIRQTAADTFEWKLQVNKVAAGTTITLVTGAYKASATAKKGQGSMTVAVADFRDQLNVDNNFKQLDAITIGYMTDTWPIHVSMDFTFKAGAASGVSAIGYTYLEREDHSGSLGYEVRSTSADLTVVQTTAGWTTAGPGRARGTVTEGTYKGFILDECWDKAFTVTLYAERWPGGKVNGDEASCPVIAGF
jgi:hypothetical protein